MTRSVGSLLVRIGADTSGLRRGGRNAETTLQRLSRQADQVAGRLGKFAIAAAAAGAAITTHLVNTGIKAVSEQAKLARRLDSTIDSVRGLQMAASDSGVEVSTMNDAMERLSRSVGEARSESGQAHEVFQELGIEVENFARMNAHERFATLADRMNDADWSADQVADALRRLGIRQGEITNLIQDGGDAIRFSR